MRTSRIILLALSAILAQACGGLAAKPDAAMGNVPSEGPVGRTMKNNGEKFVNCARDAVSVQTGTPQNIQLKFWVDTNGNVTQARIESMSAPDPDLHGCVLRQLRKIKFPMPSDGRKKEITYPLVLKPE